MIKHTINACANHSRKKNVNLYTKQYHQIYVLCVFFSFGVTGLAFPCCQRRNRRHSTTTLLLSSSPFTFGCDFLLCWSYSQTSLAGDANTGELQNKLHQQYQETESFRHVPSTATPCQTQEKMSWESASKTPEPKKDESSSNTG